MRKIRSRLGEVPPEHVSRAPKPHAVGKPPNPRQPLLVRDVKGGVLRDLFEIFPDLPRAPRPAARVRLRRVRQARAAAGHGG